MPPAVVLRGQRQLNAAFALADRETRAGVRAAQRDVAEPVRSDAEALARQEIPRISERWAAMRVGVTRTLVYVAPRQRGVKGFGRARYRRPHFAGLLMGRAMEPALELHAADLERRVDAMLDDVCDRFNRGH